MKRIVIVLLVLSFCGLASAQGFKIGAAGILGFPTGDWAEVNTGTAGGGEAFGVVDIIAVTLTARVGYMNFGENEIDVGFDEPAKYTTTAVPILAGLRWNFGAPVGPSFYAGLEAGVSLFTVTYENAGLMGVSGDETSTEFTISPNIGMEIAGFEIGAFYNFISESNYWGLRLGWGIGI